MSPRRALRWVGLWVFSAAVFGGGVMYFGGRQHGVEFIACYLIEWSLSVDNLFVFLLIFRSFGVDSHRQLRVLNWGIFMAVVLRLAFILIGVALVQMFRPILYLFGLILIYSAVKMVKERSGVADVRDNYFVRLLQRYLPMTPEFDGDKFLVSRNGKILATPMMLVLVAVNLTDVVFAVDSVPAAFAITLNPWIIFSANVFAILGLRSLFFVLSHADQRFWTLKYGVAMLLAFVGLKMLAMDWIHLSQYVSLGVIVSVLALSIAASFVVSRPDAGSAG